MKLKNTPKFFIEVGSCDFDTLNNLADAGWHGMIIDPMEKYLNNIPRKTGVDYIPCAIDHQTGESILYTASDEMTKLDSDYAGMSTMVDSETRNWGTGRWGFTEDGTDFLNNEIRIKTITFRDLFQQHHRNIQAIDFLKIDTEGYDFEVLKSFPWDLTNLKPNLIKVEHIHLQNSLEMKDFLIEKGYYVCVEKTDFYAIRIKE